jgi:organic hydroperoxide reductase OsmC/OhrA
VSEHHASIRWRRETNDFRYESYGRDHDWEFPGGVRLRASAAPDFLGNPDAVDPEEAFVAALSSCHMLTLLAIAARKRWVVDTYEDRAVGFLEKDERGQLAITRVVLRPRIGFSEGRGPDGAALARLHESAHRACFIANSVRTEITVEAQENP